MSITPTKLRQNLYSILDEVLESGVPAEINRNGKILHIVPVGDPGEGRIERLRKLPTRADLILVEPEDLVSMDWSVLWSP